MGAEQSVHPLDPLPKTEQVGSRALVILPSAPSQTGSAPIMFFFGWGGVVRRWRCALTSLLSHFFFVKQTGYDKKKRTGLGEPLPTVPNYFK